MTKFLDGPAAGKVLDLRRAPLLLRVVIDRRGNVDALDQVDDVPHAGETIHVYRLQGPPQRVHLCIRGKGRSGSGWREIGEYALNSEQPADEVARDNRRWRAWAEALWQKEQQEKPPDGA